jgi:hypothetical protein
LTDNEVISDDVHCPSTSALTRTANPALAEPIAEVTRAEVGCSVMEVPTVVYVPYVPGRLREAMYIG